jgi:hypothetical protein
VARLGKNVNGYRGESIDIYAVLGEVREVALANGWSMENLPAAPGLDLLVLQRHPAQARHRIYISTGIHGDEPAGPLAVREMLIENNWPETAEILLCPCLNPTGFVQSTRTSAQGTDLNRDYRDPRSPEVRAHVRWFERQPRFDLSFCVHEDWEAHGFYIYELNPESRPSLAEAMVRAVRSICPIDHSTLIDGRDARDGIIRPHLDPASRPDWPEAFYLISLKTPQSYTLEAPSDFPLPVRVKALLIAMRTALDLYCSRLAQR